MPTDTSERGLERLICTALTGSPCDPGTVQVGAVRERPAAYAAAGVDPDPTSVAPATATPAPATAVATPDPSTATPPMPDARASVIYLPSGLKHFVRR